MSRRRRRARSAAGGSPPRVFMAPRPPERFVNRFLQRGPRVS